MTDLLKHKPGGVDHDQSSHGNWARTKTLYRGEGSHDRPSYYPASSGMAGGWWTDDTEKARRYAINAGGGEVYEIEVNESEYESRGLGFFIPDPAVRERRRKLGRADLRKQGRPLSRKWLAMMKHAVHDQKDHGNWARGIRQAWRENTGVSGPKFTSAVPIDLAYSMREFNRLTDGPDWSIEESLITVREIGESMAAEGWQEPIVIEMWFDHESPKVFGRVTEGNHRLEVAKRFGMSHVPARVIVRSSPFSTTGSKLPPKEISDLLKVGFDDTHPPGLKQEYWTPADFFGDRVDVRKHAVHDQKDHGNWARGEYWRDAKRGPFWHFTDDPEFSVDPERHSSEQRPFRFGPGAYSDPSLYATSAPWAWMNHEGVGSRRWAAELDLSEVDVVHDREVARGVDMKIPGSELSKVRVVRVVPASEVFN